jgi:methionine sulfoxide reductase heme-binding subunit
MELHWAWPWNDRAGRLSPVKALTFAAMFYPGLWLIYQVETGNFGRTPLAGLTYWSGVWATAMLLAALAVTPAAKVFRWPQAILVRRMIGVTALLYSIAHLFIYFALRFWDFESIAYETFTRISLIVATVSLIGLIPLGVTSLDAAVKWMGAKKWQRLHNTVYVLTALALIHFLLSPGVYPPQYLMTGMFFWLMVWRSLEKRGKGGDIRRLVLLAIATWFVAAGSETLWVWVYHGFEPGWTFANNFRTNFGISPAWKVFAVALAIPLVAYFRKTIKREAAA